MKIVMKILLVIFLLLVMTYSGLRLYGKYLIFQSEKRVEEIKESIFKSGNGFGGEAGLEVVDSGYDADAYFWIDNDTLVFTERFRSNQPDKKRAYVWNLRSGKPALVNKKGGFNCYRDGYIYYSEFTGLLDEKGNKARKTYRSVLASKGGEWLLEENVDIREIWPLPSDRYELEWTGECRPWFRLKREARTEMDVPEHRFRYLTEFGWMMKWIGINKQEGQPKAGIYKNIGEIYSGNEGEYFIPLPDIPEHSPGDIDVMYLPFLEKYLLANRIDNSNINARLIFVVDKTGLYQRVYFPEAWKNYRSSPILTRKGLVWSGFDITKKATSDNNAGFILDKERNIHKVIHGYVVNKKISPDGCRLSFIGQPISSGSATLKVLNICSSTIHGNKLGDVNYGL